MHTNVWGMRTDARTAQQKLYDAAVEPLNDRTYVAAVDGLSDDPTVVEVPDTAYGVMADRPHYLERALVGTRDYSPSLFSEGVISDVEPNKDLAAGVRIPLASILTEEDVTTTSIGIGYGGNGPNLDGPRVPGETYRSGDPDVALTPRGMEATIESMKAPSNVILTFADDRTGAMEQLGFRTQDVGDATFILDVLDDDGPAT